MSRLRAIVIDEPKQGDADATVRRCYYSPLLAAPLSRVRAEPCKAQDAGIQLHRADRGAPI